MRGYYTRSSCRYRNPRTIIAEVQPKKILAQISKSENRNLRGSVKKEPRVDFGGTRLRSRNPPRMMKLGCRSGKVFYVGILYSFVGYITLAAISLSIHYAKEWCYYVIHSSWIKISLFSANLVMPFMQQCLDSESANPLYPAQVSY